MSTLTARFGIGELTGTTASAVVSALIGSAFMLSTIATPLYGLYQHAFGFSQLTLTLIYASYVIGNLLALLVLGRLADAIGRRAVALPALGVSAVAALAFLFARGTPWLFFARAFSGLGVGLAVGAGTAWLAELDSDKARAARTATSTNFLGLAIGAALAGALAQFAPWPLHLVFVLYLALLTVLAVLLASTEETVRHPKPLKASTFAPRLGLPSDIRARFITPAVAVFNAMALVGFYGALIPTILASDLRITSHFVAGAVVAEVAVVVALTIVATARLDKRIAMLASLVILFPALAAIVAAQVLASLPLLLLATAIAGVATGLGYSGSVQVINTVAPADRRSEVVSLLMLVGFIGNALPVIGIGALSGSTGQTVADIVFAGLLALLAAAGLLVGARSPAAAG